LILPIPVRFTVGFLTPKQSTKRHSLTSSTDCDHSLIPYTQLMKNLTDNYFTTVNNALFHIATILAFWVGVVTFAAKGVREWYNNGGQESIALFVMRVLHYLNSLTESLYYSVEETVDLPREV